MGFFILQLILGVVLPFIAEAKEFASKHAFAIEEGAGSDPRLNTADELFSAELYTKAIAAYQALIADLQKEQETNIPLIQTLMRTRFHLALAYLQTGQANLAIPLLESNTAALPEPAQQQIQRNSLYLLALAYYQTENFDSAAKVLTAYLTLPEPPTLAFPCEARIELGRSLYRLRHYNQALQAFAAAESSATNPDLKMTALINLARANLAAGNESEAERSIAKALLLTPDEASLHFEAVYVQGDIAYRKGNFLQAADYFHQSISHAEAPRFTWYADALSLAGWSCLKYADLLTEKKALYDALTSAEKAFETLVNLKSDEEYALALAQCLLMQASRLENSAAYHRAEAILAKDGLFLSAEAKTHALLLRAEAAPDYIHRDAFYKKLTAPENSGSSFYAKGWYMRGLNDYDEGTTRQKNKDTAQAKAAFESSATAFANAYALLKLSDKTQAANALKYQALALANQGSNTTLSEAYTLVSTFMSDTPQLWHAMPHPEEMLYHHGFFAGRLAEATGDTTYLSSAQKSLSDVAAIPSHKFADQALLCLGGLHYRRGDYARAEEAYLQLIREHPNAPNVEEAWLWAAYCSDRTGADPSIGRRRRQHLIDHFPNSRWAPEAFFTMHTYQEYLQGDKSAVKHLGDFCRLYPQSPLLVEAYYLIGLDSKRDRKTVEGKWIRKKSFTDAIDAFQHVESLYDDLVERDAIPDDKKEMYAAMRFRAMLERAMANLAIAEEAQGAKRHVYLEYAEEVFQALFKMLPDNGNNPLYSECAFGLGQTYLRKGDDKLAEECYFAVVAHSTRDGSAQGYYLARSWNELGKIALAHGSPQTALERFKKAEDASKGTAFNTDQRLELLISQSSCLQEMERFDDALLILSKAVNDDAVSSLRLKAMYLRAEVYEAQGRSDLARKQLESMIKKGGTWARKAQEKLVKDYGY